jgi:hypothetical protein
MILRFFCVYVCDLTFLLLSIFFHFFNGRHVDHINILIHIMGELCLLMDLSLWYVTYHALLMFAWFNV